jgi:hypothetical protein
MDEYKKNVIQIIQDDGWLLKYYEDFWDDDAVVLAAVKDQGDALQFASGRLKATKEIVIAAVENNPYALQFAAEELQVDDDILDICEYKDD